MCGKHDLLGKEIQRFILNPFPGTEKALHLIKLVTNSSLIYLFVYLGKGAGLRWGKVNVKTKK